MPGDLEDCMKMDSFESTRQFWAEDFQNNFSLASHRAFLIGRINQNFGKHFGYWVLSRKSDDAFLGWLYGLEYSDLPTQVELGWRLLPAARGQGFATEGALFLLRHFEALGTFRHAVALVHHRNTRSIRVSKAIGMVKKEDLNLYGDNYYHFEKRLEI